MFGFFKKKPAPPTCPANPGIGIKATVAFANSDRTWTEEVNLIDLAETVFEIHGYTVANHTTWLEHAESGFSLLPQLVEFQPLEKGGVRTATTMQTSHPTLSPSGVFEFQHSTGDTMADSISKGFDQWVQTDFVALLAALQPKPASCTTMVMSFPAKDGNPERIRRAVLGPVAHFMQNPPREGEVAPSEEHPFCACCLLTRSFEAFKDLIEGDEFNCLRLFAARDTEGIAQADCRVNGENWEKGAQSLREYAKTWPAAGYEFRKQYVVLQTIEKRAELSA
jgi:hypothetical protein